MPDDDIRDDADRHRIKKRGGAAHPEPGQLFEHTDDNPHHRLATFEPLRAAPHYRQRDPDLLPERCGFTKLIFLDFDQPVWHIGRQHLTMRGANSMPVNRGNRVAD